MRMIDQSNMWNLSHLKKSLQLRKPDKPTAINTGKRIPETGYLSEFFVHDHT